MLIMSLEDGIDRSERVLCKSDGLVRSIPQHLELFSDFLWNIQLVEELLCDYLKVEQRAEVFLEVS